MVVSMGAWAREWVRVGVCAWIVIFQKAIFDYGCLYMVNSVFINAH